MNFSHARFVSPGAPDRRLAVAPMMDWTDRHCRFFMRRLTRHTLLYTEMVTAAALVHGDAARLLDFDPAEQPVALQLGGSDPEALALAARKGAAAGYLEINLNVGCPSARVRSGRFGACLMAEPDLVARCVDAMVAEVSVPVTVKTRIGIDDQDSFGFLCDFVHKVSEAGCETFIVHARKAWLSGLSPKQNREIPPLDHDRVYRLKDTFPELEIIINGGITSLEQARAQLDNVDGVMMGRAAYHDPYLLSRADSTIFGDPRAAPSREEVVQSMLPYVHRHLAGGERLARITRHMMGLYLGQPGARCWRRYLSEEARKADAGAEVILAAMDARRTAA